MSLRSWIPTISRIIEDEGFKEDGYSKEARSYIRDDYVRYKSGCRIHASWDLRKSASSNPRC